MPAIDRVIKYLNGEGPPITSLRMVDDPDNMWTLKNIDGEWYASNYHVDKPVALKKWLAFMTKYMREQGLIGDGTTATINRVEVCIIKEGDKVCWICPNDPEFSPELGAHEATDEENSPPVMTVTIEGVTYSCESPPRKKRGAGGGKCPGAPSKSKKLKQLNV